MKEIIFGHRRKHQINALQIISSEKPVRKLPASISASAAKTQRRKHQKMASIINGEIQHRKHQ